METVRECRCCSIEFDAGVYGWANDVATAVSQSLGDFESDFDACSIREAAYEWDVAASGYVATVCDECYWLVVEGYLQSNLMGA